MNRLLAGWFFMMISAGSQAGFTIVGTVGINGGVCSYSSIAAAIADAERGDTIYVTAGTYTEKPGLVDKSLTFRSATNQCQSATTSDVIIDGEGTAGNLFQFDSAIRPIEVEFFDFRLQNANAPEGGLVHIANANVTFTNSAFEDGFANHGGCVFVGGGSLTLVNVFMYQCVALEEGGGIYQRDGALDISEGEFEDNGAVTSGGAIYLDLATENSGRATISQTQFTGNGASTNGGAIAVVGGNERTSAVQIQDSAFNGNMAEENGGAVFVDGLQQVSVSGGLFFNNSTTNSSVTQGGGALHAVDTALLTLSEVDFLSNSSDSTGGALHLRSVTKAQVNGGTIVDNEATDFGGGVLFDKTAITLDGTMVNNNRATSGSSAGGGIYAFGSGHELSGRNLTLTENSAETGGAFYTFGGSARFDNSRFLDNSANGEGGAIAIFGAELVVRGVSTGTSACGPMQLAANTYCSEFNANRSNGSGGAIYIARSSAGGGPSNVLLENTAFLGNRGTGDGMAIVADDLFANQSDEPQSVAIRNVLIQDTSTSLAVISPVPTIFGATETDLTLDSVTIASNGGHGLILEGPDTQAHLRNTLMWDNAAPSNAPFASTQVTTECAYGEPEQPGSWNLGTAIDPLFVTDIERGDFRLDPLASPLIDVCSTGPVGDLDGAGRPADAGWEPGAFEAGSAGDVTLVEVTPVTRLITSEDGGSDTFDVSFLKAPLDDVTIMVSSSQPTEGEPSTAELTFTPENWDQAQTVTVTGVDDGIDDGDQAYQITLSSFTSADAAFNGLIPILVSAINVDDDGPGPTDRIFADGFE